MSAIKITSQDYAIKFINDVGETTKLPLVLIDVIHELLPACVDTYNNTCFDIVGKCYRMFKCVSSNKSCEEHSFCICCRIECSFCIRSACPKCILKCVQCHANMCNECCRTNNIIPLCNLCLQEQDPRRIHEKLN